MEEVTASRKPSSVPRVHALRRFGEATIIPLAPPLLAESSDRPGGAGRAVRLTRVSARRLPPYLVLLRTGFCLPPMLPPARCALTAPFHPYLEKRVGRFFGPRVGKNLPTLFSRRYIFCATVLQVALTGRYPAYCPPEFGLSSLRFAGLRRLRRTAIVWLAATNHCSVSRRFPG